MPVVVCGECETRMKVPDNVIGKKIRCKSCSAVFLAEDSESEAPIKVKEPTKKPAAAKPKPKEPQAPPPPGSVVQKRKAYEEDIDDGIVNYNLDVDEKDNLPRCPHCAKELPSETARICNNCGYDTVLRKRHETRAVYEPTFGERFMHLLPGFACLLVFGGMITGCVFCFLRMRGWLEGTFFQQEDDKTKWNIQPGIVTLAACVFTGFVGFKLMVFAVKRLFINYRPIEKKIADD